MDAADDKGMDPAQLLEGADRLEAMRQELQVAHQQLEQLHDADLGHAGLEEALRRFAEHMSGELSRIAETMQAKAEELRMAGEAYTEIESMTSGGEPEEG